MRKRLPTLLLLNGGLLQAKAPAAVAAAAPNSTKQVVSTAAPAHKRRWEISVARLLACRAPMTHQTDALAEFQTRLDRGSRGWLLWMTVGAGKTLITALALAELADRGQLPAYVIYTAPKESMESVTAEYKRVGIPVRRVTRANELLKSPPQPYCVLFVEHDHVRDLTDVLEPLAPEAVVIVDEVHKMLSRTTKRTRVGTALAQMSKYFIALTGTLIVNNDPQTLAQWLVQIHFKLIFLA